ncbi:Ribose 5-phosphate isomerase B [Bacillus badius]|uniref:Ribose 5-phosphate isomerase B n=1 Tax=Bacillus badius TaxID=1455 RepID=A0ABR5ASX5_BACBA|nr:Ribose 5-phosphate isomerase B [Bacillus badius]
MEGAQTPAGSAGQARPRRRFGAEEARRPPAESEAPGMESNRSHPQQNKTGC